MTNSKRTIPKQQARAQFPLVHCVQIHAMGAKSSEMLPVEVGK